MALDQATARRAIEALLKGLLGDEPEQIDDLSAQEVGRHIVIDLRHTSSPLQPEPVVLVSDRVADLVVHVPATGQMFDVTITERKPH